MIAPRGHPRGRSATGDDIEEESRGDWSRRKIFRILDCILAIEISYVPCLRIRFIYEYTRRILTSSSTVCLRREKEKKKKSLDLRFVHPSTIGLDWRRGRSPRNEIQTDLPDLAVEEQVGEEVVDERESKGKEKFFRDVEERR